jgi:hypothetical protein
MEFRKGFQEIELGLLVLALVALLVAACKVTFPGVF